MANAASRTTKVPVDIEEMFDYFMKKGWGDGLPFIPPTRERVERMLEANPKLDPDELLGLIPPRRGHATIRQVAVNAVMAGCRPEYLPVVVTAVQCVLDPSWNLPAIQATTHPAAPLVVINGPIAKQIGANWSYGVFGPGNRANATIGRAMRLIFMNIGGARPGAGDQSGQGQPSKYTYCIAENEVESPWEPLHVTRGLHPEQSAVTVFGGTNPENVNDHVSGNPVGILTTMADVIATMGSNNTYYNMLEILCVFGPEHAQIIASHGWTREDVQYYLYEHAREPLGKLRGGGMYGMHTWPNWMTCETDDDKLMPVVRDPRDMVVMVSGAKSKHSAVVKSYAANRSVTLPLVEGS
jgi:hypothetical protein